MNIHFYPTPFTHETRILRITKSLIEQGSFKEILIVAAQRTANTITHESIDSGRRVWRVPTRIKRRRSTISKVLNMIEWYIRCFIYCLQLKKVDCVNAHSLSVLPLCVLISVLKRTTLIYDPHEIETETTETTGIRKAFSKVVERCFLRSVDLVCLTSNGHQNWYQQRFPNLQYVTVRNCPYMRLVSPRENRVFNEMFKIPLEHDIFIYQGALSLPRGVDIIRDVFAQANANKHIVFMGFGPEKENIQLAEKRYPNIHFLDAVEPDEVWKFTSGAHVGIHMMDDSCVNHLHALPNKPMEYFNAGLPAIVTDLPEMGMLVRDSEAGWVVKVGDSEKLLEIVNTTTVDEILEKSVNARNWVIANNWELEEQKLIKAYASLGFEHVK